MASLGELRYELSIDTKDADSALKSLDAGIDDVESNLKQLDKQAAKTAATVGKEAEKARKAAEKEAEKAKKAAQEQHKAMVDSISKASVTGSKAVAAFVVALGAATVALGVKAVKAASDLEESMNAVKVTFGEASDVINAFGENSVKQAGLSRRAFNEAVVPIGAMLQNMGQSAKEAANNSVQLAQRAADLASVFNTDLNQAITAIQAGLRGEADPLERFGVGLSETAVQAYAVKAGIAAAGKELTAQQKATARLGLLFEQTNKFAGDFVNTSDGLANSQRIAAATLENVSAEVGERLIPTLKELRDKVIVKLADLWTQNKEAILDFAEATAKFVAGALTSLVDVGAKVIDFFVKNKEAVIVLVGAVVGLLVPGFIALASAAAPVVAAMTAAAAAGALFAGFATILVKNINGLIGGFGDISNATEDTVSAVENMSNKASADIVDLSIKGQNAFREMSLNGGRFTKDLSDDVVKNANEMSAQFNDAIDKMVVDSKKSLQDLASAGIISSDKEFIKERTQQIEDRAAALRDFNKEATAEIGNLSARAAEVQKIIDDLDAKKNLQFSFEIDQDAKKKLEEQLGMTLTPDQFLTAYREQLGKDLNEITSQLQVAQQSVASNALAVTSASTQELLGIQQRLAQDSAKINADQAEELLNTALNAQKEAKAKADQLYQDTLADIEQLRLAGTLTNKEAEAAIQEADRQRTASLQGVNQYTKDILTGVQKYANEQGLIFDRSNGQLLTKQEYFWQQMKEDVKSFTVDAPKTIYKFFDLIIVGFVNFLLNLAEKAGIGLSKLVTKFGDYFAKLGAEFGTWLREVAIPWARQVVTDVVDGLKALPGAVLQLGKDTIQGFINGVTAMYQDAIDSVSGFGQKIINSIKEKLGIASPSKVFREFGGFTAEGFLVGFEDKSPDAVNAMTRFVTGLNKETSKLNKKALDYTDALQELESVLQGSFDRSADAIREFVNINQDAQKKIRDDLKETEKSITDLQTAFQKSQADDQKSFVSDAAGIVIKAQEEMAKLEAQLADLIQQRQDAQNSQKDTSSIDQDIADAKKSIAEKQSILESAGKFEVDLSTEIQKQKDFNALNELEQLKARFEEEKAIKLQQYQEELAQLEQRKSDLEANLAEQEQIWTDFTTTLDGINKDFTTVYQDELLKREQLTKASVDNLVAQYQRLAAAAQAARSAGANIGGVNTGAGFAEGGYTGDGSPSAVAGVVHKGEYVAPAWLVKAAPNLFGALEGLRQMGQGVVNNNHQKNFSFQVTSNNQGAADPYRDMNYMRWLSGYAF